MVKGSVPGATRDPTCDKGQISPIPANRYRAINTRDAVESRSKFALRY
jgi:hypothetical protein